MKFVVFIGFIVLVLAGWIETAMVKAPQSRLDLFAGNITVGDRLLLRQYIRKQRLYNTVQSEDLTYRGNGTTRITAIRAIEQGGTQFATVWVVTGGIGWQNVTLRFQSYRGYGYYYLVDVYGRTR